MEDKVKIMNSCWDQFSEFIDKLKQDCLKDPFYCPAYYLAFERDYLRLGLSSYIGHKDYKEGKICFYRAMLYRKWMYEHREKYERVYKYYEMNSNIYRYLYYAIIAGNWDMAITIAKYFKENHKLDTDTCELYSIELGTIMENIILDNVDETNRAIDKLEASSSSKGYKKMAEGQAIAMRGLVNNDEVMFNNGLQQMLKNHVAKIKREGNGIWEYFAYDSLALALIAKRKGMNITVEHELLPAEYLEDVEIDYDSITIDEEAIIVEE